MKLITQWILPLFFVLIGLAILSGYLITQIPDGTLLRPMMGMIVILLGVHRFVASRMKRAPRDRRFGGDRNRPWESS
jgi:hypothetical protein